jgi:hypothetical protein
METQIVRMFSSTAGAEHAREQLLAAGFAGDAVELAVHEDEAGTMQGNFTVGDDPKVTGGHDYSRTFAHHAREPGCCMITVSVTDATLAERASDILDRLGGSVPGAALKGRG